MGTGSSNDVTVNLRLTGEDRLVAGINKGTAAIRQMGQSATSIQGLKTELGSMPSVVANLTSAFSTLREAFGTLVVAMSGSNLASALVDAQIAAQQIHFSLQAATGSAEGAGVAFEYVAEMSNRLGVNLQESALSYGKFSIAAKAANVSIATTKSLYEGVAEAASVLHLSNYDVQRSFLALEQMMTQGAIRSQELRIQLNAIPGVYAKFSELVKAKGIDLREALEKGTLDIKTYASTLNEAIRGSYDPSALAESSKGLKAQLERVKNELFLFQSDVSGGLFTEAATATLKQVAEMIRGTKEFTKEFGPLVSVLTVGGAALYVYGRAMTAVGVAGAKFVQTARDRITAVTQEAKIAQVAAYATAEHAAVLAVDTRSTELNTRRKYEQAAAEVARKQAKVVSLAAEVALMEREAAGGVVSDALKRKREALAVAELRVANARDFSAKVFNRSLIAREAAAVAGTRLATSEAALAVANDRVNTGYALSTRLMGGISALGRGIFSIIGGWPGVILAAGFAAKELHGWFTKNVDAAHELSEEYFKLGSSLDKPDKALSEKISETKKLAEAMRNQAAATKTSVASTKEIADNLGVLGTKSQVAIGLILPGVGGGLKSVNDLLETKIKAEERSIRNLERQAAEVERQNALFQRQQALVDLIIKQFEDVDTSSLIGKGFTKEIATLDRQTEKINARATGEVDAAPMEKLADATEELLGYEEALNKARLEYEVKVASDRSPEAKKELDERAEVLAKMHTNYDTLTASVERNANALRKNKAHDDYLAYLKERDALEKSLNDRLEKRAAAAQLEEIAGRELRAAEKERLSEQLRLREQLERDLADLNKKVTDRKSGKFGQFVIADPKKREEFESKFKAEFDAKSAAIDKKADLDLTKEQDKAYKGVTEAMNAYTKIRADVAEAERNGTLTDVEVVAKLKDVREARLRVLDAINKEIDGTNIKALSDKNATKATKEMNDTELALVGTLLQKRRLLGDQSVNRFQKGLAGQAGLQSASDELAKEDFVKSTRNTLVAAGRQEGSEQFKAEMDQALGYFDRIQAKAKGLTTIYEDLASAAGGFFDQLVSTDWVEKAQEGADAVLKAFGDMISGIIKELLRTQVMKAINQLVGLASGVGVQNPDGGSTFVGATGFASGGYIRGPGTSKSDSIPAMLSDGEFVMNSDAVKKYGLGFMHAINESQASMIRRSHFSEGGLASSAASQIWRPSEPRVNVINATGQQARVEQGKGPNGEDVINAVLGRVADSVARNGIVGQAVTRTYGVGRQPKK